MNEDTLVKTMPLPYGQEWAWYADANVIVLAPGLDDAGRERALSEVQAHWRRSCLRIVDNNEATSQPTMPLATLPARPTIREVVEAL